MIPPQPCRARSAASCLPCTRNHLVLPLGPAVLLRARSLFTVRARRFLPRSCSTHRVLLLLRLALLYSPKYDSLIRVTGCAPPREG